jgi:hypothetical protein
MTELLNVWEIPIVKSQITNNSQFSSIQNPNNVSNCFEY